MKLYAFNTNPGMKGLLSVKGGSCLGSESLKKIFADAVIKPSEMPELYSTFNLFEEKNKHLMPYGPIGSGIRSTVLAMCKDYRLPVIVVSKYNYESAEKLFEMIEKLKTYCVVLFDQTAAFDIRITTPAPTFEFFSALNSEKYRSLKVTFVWSPGDLPKTVYHKAILDSVSEHNSVYVFPFQSEMCEAFYERYMRRFAFRVNKEVSALEGLNKFMDAKEREKLISVLVKSSVACTPGDLEGYLERVFSLPLNSVPLLEIKSTKPVFPSIEDFKKCMWTISNVTTVSDSPVIPFKRHSDYLVYKDFSYDVVAFRWAEIANGYDLSIAKEEENEEEEESLTSSSSSSKRQREK